MSGIYRGPNGSATADALNIDGDKGDLTISNSGLEWTINPDAVDFSKMQNISTDVLLGRASVGSGNIEEITCTAAGRALLDDVNASAQRTTLGLGNAATATIGTEVLAYDSNLQAFVNTFTLPTTDATNGFVLTTNGAGTLSLASPGGIPDGDKGDISVSTGGTVWTIDAGVVDTTKLGGDITTAGKNLLDDATVADQRTTLGLGVLATQGDGDKGDITVSSSGATWVIDNLVITNAKLSQQYINDLTTVPISLTDSVAIADDSDTGNKKKALVADILKIAPAFAADKTANQALASGVSTLVVWGSEIFDTNNNFASNRFTPTVAGYYQINATLRCQATNMTTSFVSIYKNGSLYVNGSDNSYVTTSNSVTHTASAVVYCNGTTDYIEIYGNVSGSSPIFQFTAAGANGFSGCLVRAA